jgi:hypothetical protein
MKNPDSDHAQAVALFRYGLIADPLQLEPGSKGLYALIEHKAAGEYTIPGSPRTRVAGETLRDWLKAYRRGGFDALLPKRRADRGQSRCCLLRSSTCCCRSKKAIPSFPCSWSSAKRAAMMRLPTSYPY